MLMAMDENTGEQPETPIENNDNITQPEQESIVTSESSVPSLDQSNPPNIQLDNKPDRKSVV